MVDEFSYVLTSLGLNQSGNVDDCRRCLIQKFDVDGDGLVNYKEFEQIMLGRGFVRWRETRRVWSVDP
ncbi:hypothetical protein HPP92_011826 [Vanilla planifolia]|uniref:EF-hand domain-containing protein n=1 Tax=Vanilla planifolia TaxID=51239 RepID=A0A835V141_VANPL|nr:hypothetical protein HPP92_011826 [Vanilla planifolia]